MRRTFLAVSATTLILLSAVSCGGSKEAAKTGDEAPAAAADAAVWKPSGNEGSVTGKVSFKGTPPKNRAITMDADAVCAAKHKSPVYPESITVNSNGTLRNVFVYVKTGLEGKNFAVPDQPVTLDQDGCMYKPHVLGIRAKQNLKVVSSDQTTHNIHPLPKVNQEWNVSQAPGSDPIIRTFSRPEETIPVKCNQHAWMRAYIHVVGHPYFTVTGDDGSFKIEGLPPGEYEIEAIHEELGASTQKVTVPASGAATTEFSYSAAQGRVPSSFKMAPALVVSCCGGM